MFPVFAVSLLSLVTKEGKENSSLLSYSAPFCKPQKWRVSHPKFQSVMIHSSLILIFDLKYHNVFHDLQYENEMPSLGCFGRGYANFLKVSYIQCKPWKITYLNLFLKTQFLRGEGVCVGKSIHTHNVPTPCHGSKLQLGKMSTNYSGFQKF